MIRRLLIANRGEIAVRIARTAHRLGIDTVGVYSETDRQSLHTEAVDLAVLLAGTTPGDTYLNGAAIVAAAVDNNCDSVHPGYGFLAEDAGFARLVLDAGLIWIGPTPEQISLLGNKVAAKQAALEAGVPTSPYVELTPTSIPSDVTLPALIKAAGGGGGRGMRVVRTLGELGEAVESAAREAAAAFGDGAVFIEPYIEGGRHVEVQIIGDTHGNVIHLGERECSIQRRNQKILEESPSPGIDDAVRASLFDGAIALARHIGYQNAGTVEFLVGAAGDISFLEVNTRLQVEHPVTEAVTGVDLVELQIRVAGGESLPLSQDDVPFRGHAIEGRIVAEDPAGGWMPSTGTIAAFDVSRHVRVDSGVRAGSVVSSEYDSLLAKVIAHAPDREGARRILERALRTARIVGVSTNRDTLAAILAEPDFVAGNTTTGYLTEHPAVLTGVTIDGDDEIALLLGAVFATETRHRATHPALAFAPSGWRNLRTVGERQLWRNGDSDHPIEFVYTDRDRAAVQVGPWPVPGEDGVMAPDERRVLDVVVYERSEHHVVLALDGVRRSIDVIVVGDRAHSSSTAGSRTWHLVPRFTHHEAAGAGSGPLSPLPGTIAAVHVTAGQVVAAGDLLMVVEAMKMEHRITAVGAAVVKEVLVDGGDRVDAGDLLVRLDAIEPGDIGDIGDIGGQ